jgi:DNA-binding MarR family transcriptional regulator
MITEYLHSFISHMNVVVRQIASQNKLSLSQYFTLTNILASGVSMSQLSTILGVDNSTLTRNIDVLVARDLVTKNKSDYDRRGYTIGLSAEGERVMERLDKQMESTLDKFISDIDPASTQTFIDVIERLNWKASCHINEL